jgi:hypothetical protein
MAKSMKAGEFEVQKNDGATSYAGEKCVVVSKVEMSILARLQEKRVQIRRERGEEYKEEVWVHVGEGVTIRGTSAARGQLPQGYRPPHIEHGAALTFNVDLGFITAWLEQNRDMPAVRNKLILIAKTHDRAAGEAKDRNDFKSGFEPLTPPVFNDAGKQISGDARWPKKRQVSYYGAGNEPDTNPNPTE